MNAHDNLTGVRFGRLIAIEVVGVDKRHRRIWQCQCDCGGTFATITHTLKSGKANSCGCLRRQRPFWDCVDKSGECWVWTGPSFRPDGYGLYSIKGRSKNAHRLSWAEHYGPIPDRLCVLHRCDNPPCVNPAHLFLGTRADNNRDKTLKGRNRSRFQDPTFPFTRGETHPVAKLSDKQVAELRRRRSNGETCRALAREFGVHNSTVSLIARGLSRTELAR